MKNLFLKQTKWLLVPLVLMTLGIENVHATTINFGTSSGYWAAHTTASFTDSDKRNWSRTYDAGSKSSGGTNYSQFGNSSNTCKSLVLTATAGSAITLTSFSVSMEGSSTSTAGTIYLYKRTSGGTETQLGTATVSGTTSSTCSMSSNTSFAATDILKVSYVGTAKAIKITTMSYTYTTGGGTTYTVTYSANGGSGDAMANSTGSSITLSDCSYTAPAGKQFTNWNTQPGGGGTTYTAGQTGVTANLTLYAQWSCITPTITGQPSNGSCVQGGSPSALTVTASGGTLSYQWKQCATANGTYVNVTGGSGGTTASYTPPVSSVGTMYYKCVVTNTGSSCGTNVTSNYASFQVSEPAAAATITLENYSGSASTSGFHVGDSFTLPNENSATCNGKTFVGWSSVTIVNSATKPSAATYHEPGESVTLGATNTFYAVFAEGSTGDPVPHNGPSFSRSGSTNTVTTGYTLSATAEAKTGYYQDGSGDAGTKKYVQFLKSNTATAMIGTTPTTATVTATIGGGTTKDPLDNKVYAVWLDNSGAELGAAQVLTTKVTATTGSSFSVNLPTANATSAYGVRIYHAKESSYNVRYYSFSLSYTTPGESSYSNYTTSCGAIDPTVTFSNGTYTIGGSALDLRTLWESNSSGAVTFSVTSAGGTGASISTASFTATTAGSCTVKASQAATASYNAIEKSATITVQNPTCATPTFSPVAGTYTEAQTVSISCATASSTIYYTTNGSDPTTSSSVYTSPLTVSSTQTIKAIAAAPGYSNSAIGSATYTIRAGTTFTLLTDASSLKAGDKLIILSTDGNYALAASDGSSISNRGQTAKTYNYDIDESNVYVYNDDRDYKDVDILTLGGTSSGWTLATSESSGYYLYHTGSDNTLQIGNSVGTGYYWTISLNGSNEATINNTGYASYNIKKNSNSAIFSAYKTAQTAIKIYRYENTSPTVEVGTPSGTSFSYVYGNGPSNTETFTISGSNLTGNVVINAPSNYKIKKGSDSWSSSITLTPSSGTIASTTISIQLVARLDAGSYDGNITFTNSDDLTISPIALTGTVSKANLNPSFGSDTYTITRDVSTSTSFTLTGVPSDYTGTITYSRTNSPTVSARLVIDGTNKTFTAANYSGRWTVTASFTADGNYNAKTSGVTCVVNAVTRDTYVDNVNSQSVTEGQRTDNGVDPYVSPALADVAAGSACNGTKVHLIGWASQAFVTKVGNGTLTGADSDYTEANGFYAVGTTLPAASGTTYYAVYGEEE